MAEKIIYLIRHGQTTMNAMGKVFSGSSNVSLSEKGISDTKKVSGHPILRTVEELYVTPLVRTHQTADLLFGKEFPRKIVAPLAEMDFGDYEGVFITPESEENDPIIRQWIFDPEHLTFPGGENMVEHTDAAYAALLQLAENSQKRVIAVVAHSTTIRLLLTRVLDCPLITFRKIPCDNSCITRLDYEDGQFRIHFLNQSLDTDNTNPETSILG